MVTVSVPGDGLSAEFWFPELEASACVPLCFADVGWEQSLCARLTARATPYAREAGAFVRQTLPAPHAGILRQRGDWHGDRCVLEFLPRGVFIKPKPAGAEEVIYELLTRLIRDKLGCALAAPFRRVGDFIVQEKIETTPDAADARAFGLVLGLIFIAAITDLNAENLRACRGIPVPIDVECAFDFRFYAADPGTLARRLREQTQALKLTLADHSGREKFSERHFLAGFVEGAIYVRRELAAVLPDPGAADRWSLRRVLLPTRAYLDFVRRKTLFRWDEEMSRQRWTELRRDSASAAVVQAEARALCSGNVPLFHQRGGTLTDGMDGSGLESGWHPPGHQAMEHLARWTDGALEALARQLSGAMA